MGIRFLTPSCLVATWATMGTIWEVFEALTEGIGDAASVRVSMHLADGQPMIAKQLSYRVVFLTFAQSLIVSSVFLMIGPNIAVAVTNDQTIENLMNNLIGTTAAANMAMSYAQVCWSLIGAQGRYGLASTSILVCRWVLTMPLSFVFIYAFNYDTRALVGSIAIGYSTASAFLARCLVKSDWDTLSRVAQESDPALDEALLASSSFDDDDDSSDSSTGIAM
jgi:Na+-driven multidrug efflux pump